MSQLVLLPEKRFMLVAIPANVRNTATVWVFGAGSQASGYNFEDPVTLYGMWIALDVLQAEAGKTFTATCFADGVAAGVDDVFNYSTSIAAAGKLSSLVTATGTKTGSYGAGTELNVSVATNGTACLVGNITVLLRGRWI